MSALTFNVVLEDAGDGWVYAHVPELPRCIRKARAWSKRE